VPDAEHAQQHGDDDDGGDPEGPPPSRGVLVLAAEGGCGHALFSSLETIRGMPRIRSASASP